MSKAGKWFLVVGEILFILGVGFLIVRKNTYPWPIKRASDIFFLFSALAALVTFFLDRTRRMFLEEIRKPLKGLALIFGGIGIAAISAYFLTGTVPNAGGVLSIARFVEVAVILVLIFYFQYHHKTFYRFVAFAQLSTLVYAFVLLAPDTLYSDPAALERFRLFENWPSNVGYYLIVSLSLVIVRILKNLNPFQDRFFGYYLAGIGLSGILMWTESRASWLGVATATILIICLYSCGSWANMKLKAKKIIVGCLVLLSLPVFGFPFLPTYAQNLTLMRLLPSRTQVSPPAEIVSKEISQRLTPPLTITPPASSEDSVKKNVVQEAGIQDRLSLWLSYSKRIFKSPLGLGPNYEPEIVDKNLKGPHNTILEILVVTGLIGLAGFIYLFFLAFRNLISKLRTSNQEREWYIYLLASLIGLGVAALFDNMSTFRLMWVVLGMAIYAGIHSGTTRDIHAPNPQA